MPPGDRSLRGTTRSPRGAGGWGRLGLGEISASAGTFRVPYQSLGGGWLFTQRSWRSVRSARIASIKPVLPARERGHWMWMWVVWGRARLRLRAAEVVGRGMVVDDGTPAHVLEPMRDVRFPLLRHLDEQDDVERQAGDVRVGRGVVVRVVGGRRGRPGAGASASTTWDPGRGRSRRRSRRGHV